MRAMALIFAGLLVLAGCAREPGGAAQRETESTATGASAVVPGPAESKVDTDAKESAAPEPDAKSKPEPVLGRAKFDSWAEGFGTARPGGFSIASTAASTVGDITWQSWGGAEADGQGSSQQNGPGNPKTTTLLRAADLGWCDGVWAYRSLVRASSPAKLSEGGLDICKGDRTEPTAGSTSAVTLSPSSLLTFGGAGGVYVGDASSKIPHTYVDKRVIGMGMFPTGTQFFDFGKTDSRGKSVATIRADPGGTIEAFNWYATEQGVEIGSTREEVRKAYAAYPRGTCFTSSAVAEADFFTDSGRALSVVYDADGKVTVFIAQPEASFQEGKHCPFE